MFKYLNKNITKINIKQQIIKYFAQKNCIHWFHITKNNIKTLNLIKKTINFMKKKIT